MATWSTFLPRVSRKPFLKLTNNKLNERSICVICKLTQSSKGLPELHVNTLFSKILPAGSQKWRNIHTSHTLHSPKTDYYKLLGVARNASKKDIKSAYFKLANQYHPDKPGNKETGVKEKFRDIGEAYQVLSSDDKRREYDSFGMAGNPFQSSSSQGSRSAGFDNSHSNIDPEELFRKIFGDAGFRMSGHQNFGDFSESNFGFAPASEVVMNLSFQQAAKGCNKKIELNITDTCPRCNGNRAEPGTSKARCGHCNGTGMETVSTGPFIMQSTCRKCMGRRVVIKTACLECEGTGKTVQKKTISVPVPAGVEDGQSVRMPVGSKEIFVTFKVEKSRLFRREGADVHSDVSISLAQAVLGGAVKVEGIYENVNLNIPAGTPSHTKIRMSGKGISRTHSYGHGDHYVHVKIAVPSKLSAQQKAIVLSLAEMEGAVNGTVNGVSQTKTGRVANADGEGLVEQIRNLLYPQQQQDSSPQQHTPSDHNTSEKQDNSPQHQKDNPPQHQKDNPPQHQKDNPPQQEKDNPPQASDKQDKMASERQDEHNRPPGQKKQQNH